MKFNTTEQRYSCHKLLAIATVCSYNYLDLCACVLARALQRYNSVMVSSRNFILGGSSRIMHVAVRPRRGELGRLHYWQYLGGGGGGGGGGCFGVS